MARDEGWPSTGSMNHMASSTKLNRAAKCGRAERGLRDSMGGALKGAIMDIRVLIIAGFVGCAYHPDDFKRPVETGPEVSTKAAAPAPPIAEGEPLYQMLYADEFGEEARPWGQRARILGWLHTAGLESEQLEALIVLSKGVQSAVESDQLDRASLGPRELEAYGPIYEKLIRGFAGERSLSAEDLTQAADDLRAARAGLWSETDPHRGRFDRTREMLRQVQSWVAGLSEEQRSRLSGVRFFLRRSLGPLARPGHYEAMVAGTWDAGDFDTLRYAGRSPGEVALDIGGWWRAEAYRVRPGEHLTALQTQALIAAAVLEPGFVSALEVALGRRDAMDFSPVSP